MTDLGTAYRRLWIASTTSNLGDGILLVGAPLVAVQLTRQPSLVAGVQVAVTLPWLLLALHAGALADRRDRRSLMIVAAGVRAGVLAGVGLAAWAGLLSLPLLYLAALAFGIGEVLFDTSSQSLLPSLVDRDRLGTANGRLIGAQMVTNNFLGAPIAGVLATLAAASVFLGPAVLYLVAAGLLLRLPATPRPARSGRTMRADIVDGLSYLRSHPTLRALAGLGALLNAANAAYFAVFVLFVVGPGSPMGLPSAAYGALAAALAAGSVLGSLAAGRVEGVLGPRRTLFGGMLALSGLMLVPVLTAAVAPIAAMAVGLGALSVLVNVTVVSSRQRIVPEALLGRVNATFRLATVGAMPLGAAVGGVVADLAGLRVLFGAAIAVQLVAIVVLQRPVTDRALRGEAAPAPQAVPT